MQETTEENKTVNVCM